MTAIITPRLWHTAVAVLLLALALTPVTAPDTQAAEWVNYPRQPDIIYYLAIEPVTDTDYYVWAGTETGAFRIHATDDTCVRYTYADGLSYNSVKSILVDSAGDSDGNIWFATDSGASVFDGTDWTHYDRGDGPGDPSIRAMALESDGDLWFATGNGVTGYVTPPPEPEPEPEPEPVPDPPLVPDTSISCFISGLMR